MTELLEKFITQIQKLPELEQKMIFNRILTELEPDLVNSKSSSLDNVINLVDQWLAEDSKYDEEVYPELENALLNNSVSIQANLLNE
jgi:hypothetical protein